MTKQLAILATVLLSVVCEDDVDSCLIAYTNDKCEGEGVMQGNFKTPHGVEWGYKTGVCNAGDYGSLADRNHGKCENEDKVCKQALATCDESTCLKPECALYSWCWREVPSCSRNLTLHPQYNKKSIKTLHSAKDICTHFGDLGKGWRVPTIGSIAVVSNNLTLASSRICNMSSLTFLIDATHNAQGVWVSSNGTVLTFNKTDWAPGHPKKGCTMAALVNVNHTLKLTTLNNATDDFTNVSVLCDVEERVIALPTPRPTDPQDGDCTALKPEEGTTLKACSEKGCNTEYTAKHEALQKCCEYGPGCLGVIETPVPVFLLGTDNLTDPLSEGFTHRRTAQSFVTPAPKPMYDGLNPVLVGTLATLVVVTFYCAIGMALRVQQGETSCPEVLPHYEFWGRLLSDCGMCCANICQVLSNARPGYGSLAMDDLDMVDNDPIPET
eukprot:TRINITY_DN1237_c0_g2_i1.p1 TRINITY_DN1237_c0_g2~~TRINITY_DN1237_c0_g2_i1.p1  ORF type:complete len:440 (+),score=92.46 TRINITY_DN1237_c0_g2_i1:46-1365(+)